jgi:hypothetical protein
MDAQDNKIDWFSVPIIVVFIIGFFGDLSFFLIVTHYFCGAIILAIFAFALKPKGIFPKLILGVVFILPGPFLMIGSFFAILVSNSKLATFLLEQAAIQGAAVLTGGAAEALEVGAIGAEAVEAGVAVTEAGEVALEAGEAAGAAAEGAGAAAEVGAEAAEVGAETGEAAAGGAEAAEEGEGGIRKKAGEKIKEKFREKLREKLAAGEDEDQARQEVEDEENEEEEVDEEYQDYEPEASKNPIDVAKKKYFAPPELTKPKEDEENESTRRLRERFARRQQELEVKRKIEKEQDVRTQLNKPKPPQTGIETQGEEDQDNSSLPKAA